MKPSEVLWMARELCRDDSHMTAHEAIFRTVNYRVKEARAAYATLKRASLDEQTILRQAFDRAIALARQKEEAHQ